MFVLVVRFAPIRPPQLNLTPINFEVPHTESAPMFIGREWIYREIEQVMHCSHKAIEKANYYRPQTKFAKVMFLHVFDCPQSWGGWHPSMLCRSPGPHPGGKLRGLMGGQVSKPTPRGEVEGVAEGGLQAHTWGKGDSRSTPRGALQAHTTGVCVSQHALRQTPP